MGEGLCGRQKGLDKAAKKKKPQFLLEIETQSPVISHYTD
jgi:hypothetical protein